MPDHVYVYPSYLRKRQSRTRGRRVPESLAVAEVTVEALLEAGRRLGYQVEVEAERHYPRDAHRFEGRLKVTKRPGETKTQILRALAQALPSTPAAAAESD